MTYSVSSYNVTFLELQLKSVLFLKLSCKCIKICLKKFTLTNRDELLFRIVFAFPQASSTGLV